MLLRTFTCMFTAYNFLSLSLSLFLECFSLVFMPHIAGLIQLVWEPFLLFNFLEQFENYEHFLRGKSPELSLRPQTDLKPETKTLKTSGKCESYVRGLSIKGKCYTRVFRNGLQGAQKVICSLSLPQQKRTSSGLSLSCWDSTGTTIDDDCLPSHKELQEM